MDFRDANFTVEAWVRPSNLTAPPKNIIGNYAGSAADSTFFVQMNTGGNFAASVYAASTVYSAFTSSSAIPNEWSHVAVVRNGTSLRIYLNGVSSASTTLPNGAVLNSVSGNIQIGREQSSYYWNGYIDDLRITKGVARYTANFSVPTAQFPDI